MVRPYPAAFRVQPRFRLEQIHVGVPVCLYCAHVAPIALEEVRVDVALLQGSWDDLLAEVLFPGLFKGPDEVLPIEYIDAHGGEIRACLTRLFLPVNDP